MKAPTSATAPAPVTAPAPAPAPTQEAQRQQTLLAVLLGDAPADALGPWLQDRPLQARGLVAYRANAAELAQRALAAAYPTVQQLLGEQAFAALARALWRAQPPQAGDLGLWGEGLAGFLGDAATLASEAYLPDVARLEWAVHGAARAADAGLLAGLHLLGENDPAQLVLRLAPGTALLTSLHPVFSIWWAHHAAAEGTQEERYAQARAALAAGVGQAVLVQRQGWKPAVRLLTMEETCFTIALLAGRSLAAALDEAGAGFAFEAWLIGAVQQQLLVAVQTLQTP